MTAVNVPADGVASKKIAELDTGLQEDLVVQYVLRLEKDLGVTVNQAALRNVVGGSDSGN